MPLTSDIRADLAEMVDIARSISLLLNNDSLSREQRHRLMRDYEDAHGEIDLMLGFVGR